MTARGKVLVAILNNVLDFDVARDEHWYRIPKDPKLIFDTWAISIRQRRSEAIR
jgi:hypothetical protein